jgi:hypothetical protein
MPKAERILLQVRLSLAEKQRIKSLAARYGFTLEKAVVEAFSAWAEKMRSQPHLPRRTRANRPQPPDQPAPGPPPAAPSPGWFQQALQLDWSKCPEVELLDDGENRLWLLTASDAPLKVVLGAVADGCTLTEISETFELELPRLAKILEFAGALQ